jgi:AhpD family alkylhydroperoxidase
VKCTFELKEIRVMSNQEPIYPTTTSTFVDERKQLSPKTFEAFKAFSLSVFADGALPAQAKQLIAIAVAHVTQCPHCIIGHTRSALRHGARPAAIMEAIWVAAEMRAGGAYAHSALAMEMIAHTQMEGSKEEVT